MSDLIDTRLNQYHLIEIVRRGGMSTVWALGKRCQCPFPLVELVETLVGNGLDKLDQR